MAKTKKGVRLEHISKIYKDLSRNSGVTSRIMAEMAVMLRTKAVTRPLRKESLMSGRVTVMNTRKLSAPMS